MQRRMLYLKKKGTDKEEDAQVTRPRCYIKSSPLRSSHCGTMVCSAAVLRVISSSFFCHLISSSQGPTVHFQCSCTCFYSNHTTENWGQTPFNKSNHFLCNTRAPVTLRLFFSAESISELPCQQIEGIPNPDLGQWARTYASNMQTLDAARAGCVTWCFSPSNRGTSVLCARLPADCVNGSRATSWLGGDSLNSFSITPTMQTCRRHQPPTRGEFGTKQTHKHREKNTRITSEIWKPL